jgi:hypothetical protein
MWYSRPLMVSSNRWTFTAVRSRLKCEDGEHSARPAPAAQAKE